MIAIFKTHLLSFREYYVINKNEYDILFAGRGVMGASALYHLSGLGNKVGDIDRFHPPHNLAIHMGRAVSFARHTSQRPYRCHY